VPQELEAIALGAALCSLHATEIHIAGAVYQTEHMQIEVLGLSKCVTQKNRYGINFTLMEYYITIITIYIQ